MNRQKFFSRWAVVITIMLASQIIYAENGARIFLEKININTRDQASLLRGAKFYAQNCMVCHTMKYLENDKLARQGGITLDKMPLKQTQWWLNIVPPDLTLLAKRRQPDWIYTYLHAFYKDATRPTGYNNLLVKDVNMPNILVPFQGEQELKPDGQQLLAETKIYKLHYYSVLEMTKSGSMTPEEFDTTIMDLVNFFVYAAEPDRLQRIYIGVGVVLFLIIFFVIAFFLKKSYWKNISQE